MNTNMNYPKKYGTVISRTFMTNAQVNNAHYEYIVQNLLVIALNIVTDQSTTPVTYEEQSDYHVDNAKIIIDTSSIGEATITIVNTDDDTVVGSYIKDMFETQSDYTKLIMSYQFIRCEKYLQMSRFNFFSEELFTDITTRRLQVNGTKVLTKYKSQTELSGNISMDADDSTFTFDVSTFENRTMYGGTKTLELYGYPAIDGTYITVDLTKYCTDNENELIINIIPPFWLEGNYTTKLVRLNVESHEITTVEPKVATGVTLTYKINGGNTGTLPYPVYYGSSNLELTFTIDGDTYHFIDKAPDNIMKFLTNNFESYEVSDFNQERTSFKVKINRIKDNLVFGAISPSSDIYVNQPTLTKVVTRGSITDNTDFAYGKEYRATLTPEEDATFSTGTIIIFMGTENITDVSLTRNVDGTADIHIPNVTANVTITAHAYSSYILVLNLTDLISDTLYSPTQYFDIMVQVQKVNETQNSVIVFQNGVQVASHSITVGTDKIIKGFTNDTANILPANTRIKRFNVLDYIDSGEIRLTLDKIVGDIPDVTDFTLNLYKLSGEKNLVDKTDVITSIITLTGTLRTSCDVMNPVIEIEYAGVPDFNYVFIPNFNRYYFVTDIGVNEKGLWTISLHVDVLMSFKDEIRANTGVIARNEKEFNNLIEDTQRLREKDDEFTSRDITTTSIFEDLSAGTSNKFKFVVGCIKGEN